jgi:hypothetical protein
LIGLMSVVRLCVDAEHSLPAPTEMAAGTGDEPKEIKPGEAITSLVSKISILDKVVLNTRSSEQEELASAGQTVGGVAKEEAETNGVAEMKPDAGTQAEVRVGPKTVDEKIGQSSQMMSITGHC